MIRSKSVHSGWKWMFCGFNTTFSGSSRSRSTTSCTTMTTSVTTSLTMSPYNLTGMMRCFGMNRTCSMCSRCIKDTAIRVFTFTQSPELLISSAQSGSVVTPSPSSTSSSSASCPTSAKLSLSCSIVTNSSAFYL